MMTEHAKEVKRAWLEKNPDYASEWRTRNMDKVRAIDKRYRDKNKGKINARLRARRKENRDKYRAYCRKSIYGITDEQTRDLLAIQGNRCAICPHEFNGSGDFHVDHDHSSGLVRGLLCRLCNMGLGSFRDDESRLLMAIEYLKTNKEKGVPANV